jgi:peptide/nickel transport system ATP-binding protein
LFIAHDLAVVEFFCDVVAVMYMGRIVEQADSQELYHNPLHPYTKALMSAIPEVDPKPRGKRQRLSGEVPSIMNPPPGCPFHPRCLLAEGVCETVEQKLEEINGNGHLVACWKSREH